MSSGGTIGLCITSLFSLLEAMDDLRLAKRQKTTMKLFDGTVCNVDVVVQDDNGRDVGFQKQDDGTYKVIADCEGLDQEQLKKQNEFINKVKRKYAYKMLMGQLKDQGYQVVEEENVGQDTVRLVARRWVS